MSNGDRLPAGSDSDRLRKEAFEQEAEALREDLVRYFASGAVLDELGLPLRQAIQEALRQVVKEALQDEDTKIMVRQQVRDTILNGLKNELAEAQPKILAALRKEWIGKWGKGLKGAAQPDAGAGPDVLEGDGERRPPIAAPGTGVRPTATDRFLKLASLVFSLLALVLVGWLLLRTFQSGEGPERAQPASSSTTGQGQNEPESRQSDQVEFVSDPWALRDTWTTRMEAAVRGLPTTSPLLRSLEGHPLAEQFNCWFDKSAIGQLDSFISKTRVDMKQLKTPRDGVFQDCVQESYANSPLPVFGAQSIVHVALQRRADAKWVGCPNDKKPADVPDLAAFQADGQPGPGTNKLLNAYLACAGFSSQIEIKNSSAAPEYLFTLYVALKELSQGG